MKSPLDMIKEKCEQYWNEPNIGDSEVHTMLVFIYTHANTTATEIERLKKLVEWEKDVRLQSDTGRENLKVEIERLKVQATEDAWVIRRKHERIAALEQFERSVRVNPFDPEEVRNALATLDGDKS